MELTRALCGVFFVALMSAGGSAQQDAGSGRSMLDDCGVPQLNSRVVGGSNAAAGAWPWQAALIRKSYLLCGGSLINDQWILTAASCLNGIQAADLTVNLGSETLVGVDPNRVTARVSTIIIHPLYNPPGLNHNIALLKLSTPVAFNNYIRPVCLAKSGSKYEGGYCWVTGFGYLDNAVPLPSPWHLQQVQVPIVPNSECDKIYLNPITEDMMCGGSKDRGICAGDAGGPLVSKSTDGSKWVQAGVVAFASILGCAEGSAPDGYARVSVYEDWIKSHIVINQPGFVVGEPTSAGTPTSSLPLLLLSSSLLLSFIFSQTL